MEACVDKDDVPRIIADVINTFRNPPWPPFIKRGENLYSGIAHYVHRYLIILQIFISSPFDKGGQGDLIKRQIGTYF